MRRLLHLVLLVLAPALAQAGAGSVGDNRTISTGTVTAFQGGVWSNGISSGTATVGVTNGRLNVDVSQTVQNNAYYACAVDGGLVAANSGADNPIWLFVNPSTSTKQVHLQVRIGGVTTANVAQFFNMYLDPVVTSSGTSVTPTKIYQAGVPAASGRCYTLPTVSSEGSIIDAIPQGQNSPAFIVNDSPSMVLDPGHTWLITANPSSNNRTCHFSFKWSEQ